MIPNKEIEIHLQFEKKWLALMNWSHMQLPFLLKESRRVVLDFGIDKAPSYDGFLICLFVKHWSSFKEDLIYPCADSNNNQANQERVN